MNESFTIIIALGFMLLGFVNLIMAKKLNRNSKQLLNECRRLCSKSEILESEAKELVRLSRAIQSWEV
jgi:hypothetical protein